jgi:Putative beta-barrel porin 2
MKKLFVFVGLATAGSATLPVYAQDLGPMQTTKIWSASASLRGFYDDNYTTSPNGDKQGSAGFEVSPSVQFNVPLQQTEIGLKYTYGLYYYQARADGNDPVDQSHQAELWLDHAFTERVQGTVKDTFIVGFEPTLNSGPSSTFRVDGNYLANNANISLTTDWTREFSTVLNYNNGVYYYQNDGTTKSDLISGEGASLAGQLNRLDQSVGMDFQWAVDPETVALIGYQFEWVLYTAGEPIALVPTSPFVYYSDDRNNQSHFLYVGFQHSFLPNLNVSAKVGAQDTIYVNNSITPNQLTPYVSANASYTYAPGSYVQLGFQHIQVASDNTTPSSDGTIAQNSQSSYFSASVNHQITAKITGSVVASIQSTRYYQGLYNNNSDWYYSLGANLTYWFNQHFSTEVGYNFDDVESNIPSYGYSRNRVYLGVTATY